MIEMYLNGKITYNYKSEIVHYHIWLPDGVVTR
jgi:hypothetical protein